MSLVVLRGALRGELAGRVTIEAIAALAVFAAVGAAAGWIADSLIRQSLENRYRQRVDWYRKGLVDAGHLEDPSGEQPADSTRSLR